MSEETLHIAMLPWLAFGHMNPFLHFAVALANAGHRISYLCTPRNISRLPIIPPHLTSHIRFIELRLPHVDGLPAHCEATVDILPEQVSLLKIVYDLLRDQVKKFFGDESPDYVLHDVIPHWVVDIARETGVSCVTFCTFPATVLAFLGRPETRTGDWIENWVPSAESLTRRPKWVTIPSTVMYRRWEAEGLYQFYFKMNDSGIVDAERVLRCMEESSAVAFRTCKEIEAEYLEMVGKIFEKPGIPIGLLPPRTTAQAEASKRESAGSGDWSHIFQWLDRQQPKSVVYVNFGSEYKMSRDEIFELAYGLELSKVPFLWVLRRPAWFTGDDDESLPECFRSRNEGRGMVNFGWAPQLEILAHPAIGASLFHAGWNSVIETLRCGHALVLLPGVFDQGLVSRMLVEKELAIEIVRDEDDGSFNQNNIAAAVTRAMVSGEGEVVRTKAKAMGAVFADQGLHDKYAKEFADYLVNSRNNKQA